MKDQINELCAQLGDDQNGRKLLLDVMLKAADYVRAVSVMEATLLVSNAEGKEHRDMAALLDRNRSLAHDALIDSLNISCRYLAKHYPEVPAGGIYPEPTHLLERNRRAIGDWAGKIVNELFVNRL
jgi:hypothetical protein